MSDRDIGVVWFCRMKQSYEIFWPWIFIMWLQMLHPATLLLPQAHVGCPCPHCSFIFRKSLSVIFPFLPPGSTTDPKNTVSPLGSSPTRLWWKSGGAAACLSPCSCSSLAVLHIPSSWEQSAGTECLHTGKDSKIQAGAMGSSSSNEQACCWRDTEGLVWASWAQQTLAHWRSEAEPP